MFEGCLVGLAHCAGLVDEPLVQIDLSDFALDRSVGLLLPQLVADRVEGVCIHRLENNRLLLAVAEASPQVSQSIEFSWGYQCELVEASPDIIQLARRFIYGVLSDTADDHTWIEWLNSQAARFGETASYLTGEQSASVGERAFSQADVVATDGGRVDFNAGHLQQTPAPSRGLSESALRWRLAKSA